MSKAYRKPLKHTKITVDWAHEWFVGALLSAAITLLIVGAGDFTKDIFGKAMHEYLVGTSLFMIIFFSTIAIGVMCAEALTDTHEHQPFFKRVASHMGKSWHNFQAVKFMKIFLP